MATSSLSLEAWIVCSRSAGMDDVSTPPLRESTACCSSAERPFANLTMKEAEVKTAGRSGAEVSAAGADVSDGAVGVLSPLATTHAAARTAIAGRARRHLTPAVRRPASENASRAERLVDKTFFITWTFMPDPFIYRKCGDSSWRAINRSLFPRFLRARSHYRQHTK